MPSSSRTALFFIAIAAVVSASPIVHSLDSNDDDNSATTRPLTLEQHDVPVCWNNIDATDAFSGPWPDRCTNSHYENAYTAPFARSERASRSSQFSTRTHTTFGPWHCCYSCKEEDGCIGWEMDNDCKCTTWYYAGDISVLEVYGGPFQNRTGTFHRGPAFPRRSNSVTTLKEVERSGLYIQ